jgi:hypothetical protein
MGQKEMAMNGKNRIIRRAVDLAVSAAFDYPLTAKAHLSRSSRLGTHTRSIQAHFRAAQSSPPRPLWFCIADMHSRSSKGLSRHTIPCDRFELPHPSSDNPAGSVRFPTDLTDHCARNGPLC